MSSSDTPRPHTLMRMRPVFSTRRPTKPEPIVLPMFDRVLQAVALAAVLSILLVVLLNPLGRLWQEALTRLTGWLSLNVEVLAGHIRIGHTMLGRRLGINLAGATPEWFALTLHAVMSIGIFGMSWAARSMPLRCGLRILCGLHGLGLVMIAVQGAYPYSLLDHTRVLYDASLAWLLLTPALLAAGFFLVERSWINRVTASLLIIGFEILALPIKLILHSVLVALLSPAVIPLLFLALGPVLDILLLAALYAWVLTWPQLKLATAGSRHTMR